MTRTALTPVAGTPVTKTTAMRRAVHYQWRHLAALRSTWILLGSIAALSLLAGASAATGVKTGEAPTAWSTVTAIQLDAVSLQLPLAALLLLPLATGPIATELSRGTARTTWLTLADRPTAFNAKLLLGAALGALTALGGTLLTAISTTAALAIGERDQPAWNQALPGILGYVLFMTCWPVIATSAAALVRNRVTAALLLVLWPLLGERLAGILLRLVPGFDSVTDWLPFAAGRAAMAAGSDTQSETDRAMTEALVGSSLSAGTGATVLIAFTATMALAGTKAYLARNAT
ncbi:hypothetical protein [Streptomyces tsukubensis]|uniref:hypothetical protein n=1 Tax=Streptomyces tsukubensis TaxID=83656 RepID=UPI00344E387E